MNMRAVARLAAIAIVATVVPVVRVQGEAQEQPPPVRTPPRPGEQLYVRATAAWSDSSTDVWITGELGRPVRRDRWSVGATAEVVVSSETATGTVVVALPAGERAFVSKVSLSGTLPGPLDVGVTMTPAVPKAMPLTAGLKLEITGTPEPLVYRAGPSTEGRVVPAAELRFSRRERVRLEVRLAPGVRHGRGRVLDADGGIVSLPVKVSAMADPATGERWMLADVALARLAPGDYVIELMTQADTARRLLTPIHVTR